MNNPHSNPSAQTEQAELSAEFRLLGRIDWSTADRLQQRLIYEAGESNRPSITVLFCEHPLLLTVGRDGSRQDIHLTDEQLRQRQIDVQWVNRGGGCILHGPGQLCVYPIVALQQTGWSVGQFVERFQQGIVSAFSTLCLDTKTMNSSAAIWGRSGILAALGIGVRYWVTSFGAYINVNPAMSNYRAIDTVSASEGATKNMGSLLGEKRQSLPMSRVRAALIEGLAESFGCPKYNLQTGHRYLLGHTPNGNAVAPAS